MKKSFTSLNSKQSKETDHKALTGGQVGRRMLEDVSSRWRMPKEDRLLLDSELDDSAVTSERGDDNRPQVAIKSSPRISTRMDLNNDSLPTIENTGRISIRLRLNGIGSIDMDTTAHPGLSDALHELSNKYGGVFPKGVEKSYRRPKNLTYVQMIQCAFLHSSGGEKVRANLPRCYNTQKAAGTQEVVDIGLKNDEIYKYLRNTFLCFSEEAEEANRAMQSVYFKKEEMEQTYNIKIEIDNEIKVKFPEQKEKNLYSWEAFWDSTQKSVRHVLSQQDVDISLGSSHRPDNIHRIKMFERIQRSPHHLMHWRCGCGLGQNNNLEDLQNALRIPEAFIDRGEYTRISAFLVEHGKHQITSTCDYRTKMAQFIQQQASQSQLTLGGIFSHFPLITKSAENSTTHDSHHVTVDRGKDKRRPYRFDFPGMRDSNECTAKRTRRNEENL